MFNQFQRPISLALLTPVKPTAVVFKEFIEASRHMFLPLLICNQTLFKFVFCLFLFLLESDHFTCFIKKKACFLNPVEKIIH